MRKPTGPGQVEPRCLLSAPGSRRLGWSLFNFDIDDASLKPEHQRWLEDNLVPLLSFPGATVALRGLASRSGASDYNKKLSDRRVETVGKFLQAKGARLTQLAATSTGEDEAAAFGQADGTEDARFRAVVVELNLPLTGETTRFDRDNLAAINDGFDDTEAFRPPWVLVRTENAFRMIRLINGQGLELVSTDPRVVTIEHPVIVGQPLTRATTNPQFLRLRAGFLGDAQIEARDTCGRVVTSLRVAVRGKLIVKAAFHYVQNRNYGTRTRHIGDEDAFLEVMNRLYRDQANIEFEKLPGSQGARNITMNGNFGTEINELDDDHSEWDAVVGQRNPAAQFNVFLVREVETDAEGTLEDGLETDTANALTTIGNEGDCLLEDNSSPAVGVTLAHEAGHCLGVRHNSPIVSTQNMLMFTSPNRGHFIPRIHAERMRIHVRA
jgi:hypothetical protein